MGVLILIKKPMGYIIYIAFCCDWTHQIRSLVHCSTYEFLIESTCTLILSITCLLIVDFVYVTEFWKITLMVVPEIIRISETSIVLLIAENTFQIFQFFSCNSVYL